MSTPGVSRSTEYTLKSQSLSEKARYTTNIVPSTGSGDYGPQRRQITFHVPAQHFIDGRSCYLNFDVGLSATVANAAIDNFLAVDGPASSLINRIVLRSQNGQTIEEITDANLLAMVMYRLKGADYGIGTAFYTAGYDPSYCANLVAQPNVGYASGALATAQAGRAAAYLELDIASPSTSSDAKFECSIPLCMFGIGLLGSSSKSIPAMFAAKAGPAFILDFYLEDPQNALVQVGPTGSTVSVTNGSYTVSRAELVLENVEPTAAFAAAMASAIQSSPDGVRLFYKTVTNHSDNITTSVHTSDISAYEFSLNYALCVMRNSTWLNSYTRYSISGWSNADAVRASSRVGTYTNPVTPYEMRVGTASANQKNSRAFMQVLSVAGKICSEKTVNLPKFAAGQVNTDDANSFLLGFNFDKQEAIDDENAVISGLDTRSGSTPLTIKVERNAGSTGQYRLNVFVGADRMVSFNNSGLVVGQTA